MALSEQEELEVLRLRKRKAMAQQPAEAQAEVPVEVEQPIAQQVRREPVTGLPDPAGFKGFGAGMIQEEERKSLPEIGQNIVRGSLDLDESVNQLFLDVFGGDKESEDFRKKAIAGREAFEKTPAAQTLTGKGFRMAGELGPLMYGGALVGKAVGAGAKAMFPSMAGKLAAGTAPAGVQTAARVATQAPAGAAISQVQFRPEETPELRAEARQTAAKIGATVGAALPIGQAALKTASHPIAFATRKVIGSENYKKAESLLKKIGVRGASIGEKSGDLKVLQAERQSIGQTPIAEIPALNEFAKTTKDFVKKEITRVSGIKDRIGAEKAGEIVTKAGRSAVDRLVKARQVKANLDFALVKAASGNGRVFPVNNIRKQLLDDLVEVGENTSQGVNIAGQLKRIERMAGDSGYVNADQAQALLKSYSQLTAGTGKLFGDIGAANKAAFGKAYLKAFNSDMNAAAKNSAISKETRDLLLNARNNYSKLSQPIDDIKDSVLGGLINKDSATALEVAQNITKLSPPKASSLLRSLDKYDPAAANVVRGYKVQSALDDMFKRDPKDVLGVVSVDPAKFFKSFGDKEIRDIWLKGGAGKPLRINSALKAIDILGGRAKIRPGGQIASAVDKVAGVLVSLNPTFLAINTSRILTPGVFRKALMTEKGITALEMAAATLKNPDRIKAKEYMAAWQFLDGMSKKEDEIDKEFRNGN